MLENYLNTKQVAEKLGLSENTIRCYVTTNRFPKPDAHLFKRNLWKRETIENWLKQQIRKGTKTVKM